MGCNVRPNADEASRFLMTPATQSHPTLLRPILTGGVVALVALSAIAFAATRKSGDDDDTSGLVQCANLVYGQGKTSVCFSSHFMSQIGRETNIEADPKFVPVHLESSDLFQFPFAVMTGEGSFSLTHEQRENMRRYLTGGGFVVASAGCSSQPWARSFRSEIEQVFPNAKLTKLDMSHPIFHTVYDIKRLDCRKSASEAYLEGLEIDGKIVLVFSSDGLNDTASAGGNCCCCGGNEIRNCREVTINLLAYTLTH